MVSVIYKATLCHLNIIVHVGFDLSVGGRSFEALISPVSIRMHVHKHELTSSVSFSVQT